MPSDAVLKFCDLPFSEATEDHRAGAGYRRPSLGWKQAKVRNIHT